MTDRLKFALLAFLIACAPALLHLTPAHAAQESKAQADDLAYAAMQRIAPACAAQGKAAQGWASPAAHGYTIHASCAGRILQEDDPGWDCRTMGNGICGPITIDLRHMQVHARNGDFAFLELIAHPMPAPAGTYAYCAEGISPITQARTTLACTAHIDLPTTTHIGSHSLF